MNFFIFLGGGGHGGGYGGNSCAICLVLQRHLRLVHTKAFFSCAMDAIQAVTGTEAAVRFFQTR